MRFCQRHWDLLRAAIAARELDDLVASSGEDAARRMAGELDDGKVTMRTFDPLMGAHNAILSNALRAIPPAAAMAMLTAPDSAGPLRSCPLCMLNAHVPGQPEPNSFDAWIYRAADDMKEEWERLCREG